MALLQPESAPLMFDVTQLVHVFNQQLLSGGRGSVDSLFDRYQMLVAVYKMIVNKWCQIAQRIVVMFNKTREICYYQSIAMLKRHDGIVNGKSRAFAIPVVMGMNGVSMR